jgi:hypothetical protein
MSQFSLKRFTFVIEETLGKESGLHKGADVEMVDYPEGIELPKKKVIKFRDEPVQYLFQDGTSIGLVQLLKYRTLTVLRINVETIVRRTPYMTASMEVYRMKRNRGVVRRGRKTERFFSCLINP